MKLHLRRRAITTNTFSYLLIFVYFVLILSVVIKYTVKLLLNSLQLKCIFTLC